MAEAKDMEVKITANTDELEKKFEDLNELINKTKEAIKSLRAELNNCNINELVETVVKKIGRKEKQLIKLLYSSYRLRKEKYFVKKLSQEAYWHLSSDERDKYDKKITAYYKKRAEKMYLASVIISCIAIVIALIMYILNTLK